MNILNKIIEHKREVINNSKRSASIESFKDSAIYNNPTYSLKKSLYQQSGIIAEFKRKSPSKGFINANADPLKIAKGYMQHGASAISVLTDNKFFGGSNQDLQRIRNEVKLPILRKDFMVDEYQFHESKSIGADIVLLIAACLAPSQTHEFSILSHELGLEVLLEIHSEEELHHINPDIDFVGINNRNLKTFEVDLNHSVRLKNQLPKGILSIAESGIYSAEDFIFLKNKGFDGFLMGEYFMKQDDPSIAFENFVTNITRQNEN